MRNFSIRTADEQPNVGENASGEWLKEISMPKNRTPSSKSSWIGMAAHQIDEITVYGASLSARCARALADAVVGTGQDLLDTDPRGLARANYSPEALRARIDQQNAEEAQTRQILGEDDFSEWLASLSPPRRFAA